jgi:hypothetical protein
LAERKYYNPFYNISIDKIIPKENSSWPYLISPKENEFDRTYNKINGTKKNDKITNIEIKTFCLYHSEEVEANNLNNLPVDTIITDKKTEITKIINDYHSKFIDNFIQNYNKDNKDGITI